MISCSFAGSHLVIKTPMVRQYLSLVWNMRRVAIWLFYQAKLDFFWKYCERSVSIRSHISIASRFYVHHLDILKLHTYIHTYYYNINNNNIFYTMYFASGGRIFGWERIPYRARDSSRYYVSNIGCHSEKWIFVE